MAGTKLDAFVEWAERKAAPLSACRGFRWRERSSAHRVIPVVPANAIPDPKKECWDPAPAASTQPAQKLVFPYLTPSSQNYAKRDRPLPLDALLPFFLQKLEIQFIILSLFVKELF
jgi:hypothetical protein